MKDTTLLALLSTISTVAAHGFITEILIDGKDSYPGYDPWNKKYSSGIVHPWQVIGTQNLDGPMLLSYGITNIACQRSSKPAQQSATAPAGAPITFKWSHWPPDHKGPITTYLAECKGDCKSANPSQLSWFKIDEVGLIGGKGNNWGTDVLIKQGTVWNMKLPKNIKSGNYILRHEIVALHDVPGGGAQMYPTCMNLRITGGGAQSNPAGVSLASIYSANTPGLKVSTKGNPSLGSYAIPGPRVSGQIGAVSVMSLNNGSKQRGNYNAVYPNQDHDPYAKEGPTKGGRNAGLSQRPQGAQRPQVGQRPGGQRPGSQRPGNYRPRGRGYHRRSDQAQKPADKPAHVVELPPHKQNVPNQQLPNNKLPKSK
ncbi:hypothetical protein TWF694_010241 [Orbilia ellipsospora]|uniref:lytic cellulose monooxygenase (C4-dehydrogenating) n=1 Tax=Orbilia ellipsospora TaxID=2528407 RepID=A0AAV9XBY0_9PEZI